MSTNTGRFVTSDGDQNCDSNPTSAPIKQKDCWGICVVDQEEYMVRIIENT